jgi:hypothetical protein
LPVHRSRQKVKTYFLPVQTAKKDRQSLPFFGEKVGGHFLTIHGDLSRMIVHGPETTGKTET